MAHGVSRDPTLRWKLITPRGFWSKLTIQRKVRRQLLPVGTSVTHQRWELLPVGTSVAHQWWGLHSTAMVFFENRRHRRLPGL